jgi:DNA-binding PadR family transcriptional regulator
MKTEGNGSPRHTGQNGQNTTSRSKELTRVMMRYRRMPEPGDLLPLTEPAFHILLALADRELHGYGIILSVEDATAGKVRLRTGTLYTAVRRMVDDGLIEESAEVPDDDRRRFYRLTPFGRAVARAEAKRVASLASLARSKGLLARSARPRF